MRIILTALLCASVYAQQTTNTKAPELTSGEWINSAPLKLSSRHGTVTVVHFWTYGCINCKRNLPIYARWQDRFSKDGVAIIGIHTPESPAEANPANVRAQVSKLHIEWPVLLDPGQENWRRWKQQYWPSVYLIDKRSRIRYRWDGEMNYGNLDGETKMTALIESLLKEP